MTEDAPSPERARFLDLRPSQTASALISESINVEPIENCDASEGQSPEGVLFLD
jgi:hypothetical protein